MVEVPNDKVGLVIGKAGSTIKELEQRSGARVQLTPDSKWQGRSELRPIQLTGTQQQLDWCKGLISEKVNVPVEQLASTQTFDGGAPSGPGGGGGAGGGGGNRGDGGGGASADREGEGRRLIH